MRLRRCAVPAALLAVLALGVIPTVASAAPKHNHGLTINATPNLIVTGESVLIYGQFNRKQHAHRLIVLWHRVNPSKHFTVIQTTRTNSAGFYEFTRADGVVITNRNWYVTGPAKTHSRTIHEHVFATVGLSVSSATGATNHPLVFSGHVDPSHGGQRVFLQVQNSLKGDDWRTVKSGRLDSSSNFSIPYRFVRAGVRDLRVLLRRDARNIASTSDTLTVSISQAQNPRFTIQSSMPVVPFGTPVTISGILYKARPTTVTEPGVSVTLFAHGDNQAYIPIATTTTGAMGDYTFTQMPDHNVVYQVRTTMVTATALVRSTAQVFEGVSDVVTLAAPPAASQVGQKVMFTGKVSPLKPGHVVYLQRQGVGKDWHTVKIGVIAADSTYSFGWTFGYPGTKSFRVLVPGGPENVSGHSAPVTIVVSLPVATLLPPAS